MEVSESTSVSVVTKEEFSKDLLHTSHIGVNTPIFTVSPLTNNPCEAVDSTPAKTNSLTISACLLTASSSVDSSKAAPFYPRVLVGTPQSSTPPVDAPQTIPVLSESERYSQQQTQLPSINPFGNQTTPITGTQLFPLILTATPANSSSSQSVGNAFAPIHVQVNNNSGNAAAPTNSSASSPVGTSQSSTAPIKVLGTNGASSSSVQSSVNPSVSTSTTCRNSVTSTGNLASVVISPQLATSIPPTFTLRFNPPTSIHCVPLTTAPSNSLLFETSVLSSQLAPTSLPQQPVTSTVTTTSTAAHTSQAPLTSTSTPPGVSLLMSSGLCPAPRVLIHKSTGLTPLNPALSSATAIPESFPLTLVTAPVRTSEAVGATGQLNMCTVTASTTDQSTSGSASSGHSPLHTPTKAKLVSLATPVSANVRLFTTASTTLPYTSKSTSTSGIYTASIPNAFSSGTVHSVISPVKAGCTGLWTNLSSSNGVSPNSLVALQSSQPLLVHAPPELVPLSPGTTSTSQTAAATARPVASVAPGGSAHATLPLSLSLNAPAAPPTVLAFSLSTTTPSTINVSGANILTQSGAAVRHSGTTNPLVVRGGCSSTVASAPTTCGSVTSVASLTNTSLLKPFNLSIPGGVSGTPSYLYTSVHSSVVSPSSGASVPQVVPINIAPARLPTLSAGKTASSPSPSASTVSARSQLQSAISSCILPSRHNLSSVFSSSSNRRRARKQQLATAAMVTVATTSSTGTAGLAIISNSAAITISPSTCSSTSTPTLTTVPICSTGSPISIAHFTPIPGRSGQAVTPTIVAIPKPILQPAPPSSHSTLSIQPLATLSPRPCGSSTLDSPQMKVPSFVPSVCSTTCTCLGTPLNAISMATATNTPTTGGYVGIRLLSVRPSPTNLPPSCPTSLVANPAQLNAMPTGVPGLITRLSTSTPVSCTAEGVPATLSGTCGIGASQLRLTTCTGTPEVSHTQAATVYVLTTSNAYPGLSTCASSVLTSVPTITANSSELHSTGHVSLTTTTTATTTTTPSYGTALMVPGISPGVVQVRFRPPLTVSNTTTTTAAFAYASSASGNTSGINSGLLSAISSAAAVTTPLVMDTGQSTRLTGPVVPSLTQTTTINLPVEHATNKVTVVTGSDSTPPRLASLKPLTSFTSSSSLLHRHLLSPQNPVHSEHNATDTDDRINDSTGDSENPTVANSVELFAAVASASTDRSLSEDPTLSGSSGVVVASMRNQDTELHCSGRLKHNAYGHRVGENHVRITAAADMATEGMARLDDEEEDEEDLRSLNDRLRASNLLRLPRKRLKLDDTVKSVDNVTPDGQEAMTPDEDQLLLLLKSKVINGRFWSTHGSTQPISTSQSTTSGSTSVHLTIDPATGCEWVLSGLPTKPSIIPRWMNSSGRSGTGWRAKSTHFLSSSEIRTKPDSKVDVPRHIHRDLSSKFSYLDDTTFSGSSKRRHRRVLSRRASLDQTSEGSSVNSSSSKRLGNLTNTDHRLLHDIIALRLQQSECRFVRFPLTHSSVLNISGWRMLSCADNFDLLVFSEHRTLQSMSSLHVSLQDWSRHIIPREVKKVSGSSPLNMFSTRSYESCELHGTPCSIDPTPVEGSESPESMSTTTASSSPNRTSTAATDSELTVLLERAVDLILGICQRKRCLINSLQLLNCRSRRLVEQFRTKAISLFDEFEQEHEGRDRDTAAERSTVLHNNNSSNNNNSSDISPASTPCSASTKVPSIVNTPEATAPPANGGSDRSTPLHLRRSARTSSPGKRHPLKRFRRRHAATDGTEEFSLTSGGSSSLLKACTKPTVLCNGETNTSHGSRR